VTRLTRYLLDVNVLIALVDPAHLQHDDVHAWFGRVGRKAFATCPITENGLLRIVGHPKYPNSPGPPSAVVHALTSIRALPGHAFWPDSISLADSQAADASLLSSQSRVTDSYLLALARAHQGQLATLDHKLATDVVAEGKGFLLLI
jgi:toxin-antitoxin system PIN domain toxin